MTVMAWLIPLFLILGFYFGKLTCSAHIRKFGFVITLMLFGLLNFLHSIIDGVTLLGFSEHYRTLALVGHELVRQPTLYLVIWIVLKPFTQKMWKKVLFAIIAVTGVWALGVGIGTLGGHYLEQFKSLDTFFEYSIFLFVGDIIHHLFDEGMRWYKARL